MAGKRPLVPRGGVLAALAAAALAARADFGSVSGKIASLPGALAGLGLDYDVYLFDTFICVYLSKPWIFRLCL